MKVNSITSRKSITQSSYRQGAFSMSEAHLAFLSVYEQRCECIEVAFSLLLAGTSHTKLPFSELCVAVDRGPFG